MADPFLLHVLFMVLNVPFFLLFLIFFLLSCLSVFISSYLSFHEFSFSCSPSFDSVLSMEVVVGETATHGVDGISEGVAKIVW